jgi:predicted amidohydrolase YtcJ
LREQAFEAVKEAIPQESDNTVLHNMQRAIGDVHALGMTGIHDIRLMGGRDGQRALKAWKTLHAQELLNIRCHVSIPGEMADWAIAQALRTGEGDDRLRIGHLKFFADGGMGARTAWMKEPYLDDGYGMPLTPVPDIEAALLKANAAGLSVMVHSIGTRANQDVIDMFARVEATQAQCPAILHRIEHLQMIEPEELASLASLKTVAASCQPNNLSLDISMIDACVGEKGKHVYPLKSILNTGVPFMMSSDAPVCDPAPLAGIYSAATRKRMNRTPQGGWHPEQALSVGEAVKAYTITPALASGVGVRLGSITPRKLADIIVLNRNIFEIEADEIADVRVDMTVFDGKIIHLRL